MFHSALLSSYPPTFMQIPLYTLLPPPHTHTHTLILYTWYTGQLLPCMLPSIFLLSSAHTWRSSPNMAWCKGSPPSRLSSSSNQSHPSLLSVADSSTVATWKSWSRLRWQTKYAQTSGQTDELHDETLRLLFASLVVFASIY